MKELIEKIGSKNLIKMGIGAIIVIICIVGFSLIYYNFFYQKSFEEIESIMIDASKQYYSEHQKKLPSTNGETINIKVSTLVSGEYMKSISEYVKNEDIACKASVNVTNINGNYRFNPLLDCGRYHKYEYIVEHIKKAEPITTEGEGLYQDAETLVYKGEKIKNNVKFANAKWRIIKIENDKLILIYNDKLKNTTWDDRYNNERNNIVGINDYKVSRIRDYLDILYKGKSIFTPDDKLLLSNYTLNIGKVGENEDDHKGELAKSVTIENQFIGLISISDYMNASLDANCKTASSASCSNYNYLTNYDYNYWTLTADKNTTHKVYKYFVDKGTEITNASSNAYVRPVIAIVNDAIYVSGTGSINKPYVFK